MSYEKHRKQAADACGRELDTEFFKALCEPVRVAILQKIILTGRADIAAIAEGMPQDRSVISRHLALLERAGIAVSDKQGRHVHYDLDGPAIVQRLERLLTAARALATICCPADATASKPKKDDKP
jgi:DNA-binding transcriptional ArsR family regulator